MSVALVPKMEESINNVLLESGKVLDTLSNRVGVEVTAQRVVNGKFMTKALQRAYSNFNTVMDDMSINLQRAEMVLSSLDAQVNGTNAGIESFFDPTGGEDAANTPNNGDSVVPMVSGGDNTDFLMDLNLNGFGDDPKKSNDGFVDLDGIDMGSNLDELDLNLLDIPNDDNSNGANDEPVDMDKLYDLIGLN